MGRPQRKSWKESAPLAIRGAEIVRQLMIYSGQESEVLELVDVSEIVKDMLELLKSPCRNMCQWKLISASTCRRCERTPLRSGKL